jgi:hypothetical protein
MARRAIYCFLELSLTVTRMIFIFDEHLHSGGVVKLVITSACHAEGRGFESRLSRHYKKAHSYEGLFFYSKFSFSFTLGIKKLRLTHLI